MPQLAVSDRVVLNTKPDRKCTVVAIEPEGLTIYDGQDHDNPYTLGVSPEDILEVDSALRLNMAAIHRLFQVNVVREGILCKLVLKEPDLFYCTAIMCTAEGRPGEVISGYKVSSETTFIFGFKGSPHVTFDPTLEFRLQVMHPFTAHFRPLINLEGTTIGLDQHDRDIAVFQRLEAILAIAHNAPCDSGAPFKGSVSECLNEMHSYFGKDPQWYGSVKGSFGFTVESAPPTAPGLYSCGIYGAGSIYNLGDEYIVCLEGKNIKRFEIVS